MLGGAFVVGVNPIGIVYAEVEVEDQADAEADEIEESPTKKKRN